MTSTPTPFLSQFFVVFRRQLTLKPPGLLRLTAALALGATLTACSGGSRAVPPAHLPTPAPPSVEKPKPALVLLSKGPEEGAWIIESHAMVNEQANQQRTDPVSGKKNATVNAKPYKQLTTTRATVHWKLNRTSDGAIKAAGQVDSFTVDSVGTAVGGAGGAVVRESESSSNPMVLQRLFLVDAAVDSVGVKVLPRPLPQRLTGPLPAENCDSPQVDAARLAGKVLVRVPDGVAVGDSWRDSTSVDICRSGVTMKVVEIIESKLENLTPSMLVVVRKTNTQLSGEGGSAFRHFELTGNAIGSEKITIDSPSGLVRTLESSSTLTLETTERRQGFLPIVSQVEQKLTTTAKRVTR